MDKTCTLSHTQGPVFSGVGNDTSELQVSVVAEYRTLSVRELIETFPEARAVVKRLVKEDEGTVRENQEIKQKIVNELVKRLPLADIDFASLLALAVARTDLIPENRYYRQIRIDFFDSFSQGEYAGERLERNRKFLRLWEMPKNMTRDFGDKIAKAKAYPIETLVKAGSMGFAKCPLHADKTASLKVYKKENRWWCYSCNTGGDVIDLYQKVNGCDFKTAVEKLA